DDGRVVKAATTVASLEAEHEIGNINKTQPTATLNEPSPRGTGLGSEPRLYVTTLGDIDAQNRFDTASKRSYNLPLSEVNTSGSGEDSIEHQDDLIDFVPPTPHDLPLSGGHTSGMLHDVEEEPRRATPPPTLQSQEKDKGKMFEREQRTGREKAKEQEAKDVALIEQMEDVQARIDADELLAERLQQEEREQFTIDEQARMLVDLIAERKRSFAAQRAEQIINKPPTKAQLRNKMMVTYLKHMGKYTHNQLKSKNFKEIQMLYEREQKWINDFVPMDSEEKLEDDDAEKEELRACFDIVPVDDIDINVESS
nr:hypothetical protein [Tanacetum cinerariifolium]